MLKLNKTTITFQNGDNTVNIFVSPYTNEKDKNLRGFADVSVLSKDKKMITQNNGYHIIEGKTQNLFIVEPRQRSYKDKDDNWVDGKVYFLEKREVKDDIVKRIIEEALVK